MTQKPYPAPTLPQEKFLTPQEMAAADFTKVHQALNHPVKYSRFDFATRTAYDLEGRPVFTWHEGFFPYHYHNHLHLAPEGWDFIPE